ncbi:MAG: GTP-binding protein [Candidatus Lokiarchaeota archaeon]|nr:GTP-binding protein [Candidatus Lokiarchaeota archaeon]
MVGSNKYFFKICIVGDSEVGKTTILNQYLKRRFVPDAQRTIGSNFFVKYVKFPEIERLITLQVWDLAGQPRFRWVRYAFYKGAKGIVYAFDLTRKNTLESILTWKEEVESKIGIVPNILVGNKLDLLTSENRAINFNEVSHIQQQVSASEYLETSAKNGTKVDDVFSKLTLEMYKSKTESIE